MRLLIIRYGGFGDAIQASSILPELAVSGYEITWDASEHGEMVLRGNPHLDQIIVTPSGSVPPQQLPEYWNARTNGFHRVINLCESVEEATLWSPRRLQFFHEDETRRRLADGHCYIEHIHKIAGTNGPFVQKFYPTLPEKEEAQQYRGAVMVVLGGSAEYKRLVHATRLAVALRLLNKRVILAGGPREQELARDIAALVPGVLDATEWDIRTTMATAQVCDVVIGPETGVMNAVANEPCRKVLILSHSSPEQLAKHWENTMCIVPQVPCHPCHRLHETRKFCPRGPSGEFAACGESVGIDVILDAMEA